METPNTHEGFMLAVQNHLKEREGCPVILIVHSPHGLEMQLNFLDHAMQMGIIRAAKKTIDAAFDRQLEAGFKSGENQLMVSAIKDATESNKKKVN